MSQSHMLVLGHGYSAGYLTGLLREQGWSVTGTTRQTSAFGRIAAAGAQPMLWPGQEAGLRQIVTQADAILISAGPDEGGDPALRDFAPELARARAGWIGYLSTTGVYGDRQGAWVDEGDAPAPTTRRGAARLRAEDDWQALARDHNLPLHIFRIAGIYGPQRGPFAKLRAGTARRIIKPGQVFSRIHVADLAQVLAASIRQPRPGAIYNVCDDDPAPPEDVIAHAAALAGLPVPPAERFDTATMTPMARSFYAESKRVRNDLIKSELGVSLRYPDFHSGLREILQDTGA